MKMNNILNYPYIDFTDATRRWCFLNHCFVRQTLSKQKRLEIKKRFVLTLRTFYVVALIIPSSV